MSYQPIKVEFVNPFLDATSAVFKTMLGTELKRGALYLRQGMTLSHEISGIIGLSGKAKGTVLIGMNTDFAISVTEKLLGDKPDGLTPDVIDAVGELANMIAGGAKTRLEELNMSISLPSVIAGKNHTVSFPSGAVPIGIPFESDLGAFSVEVSLVEVT
jgi:chemotaxis protein CheX